MQNGQTLAVINGVDKLVALKLAELLANNDIKVIGIGEYVVGTDNISGFEFLADFDGLEVEGDYWFDFNDNEDFWKLALGKSGKLVLVGINRQIRKSLRLSEMGENWRGINCHGVYGPGMEESQNREEVGFLVKAIDLAIKNKNLELPDRSQKMRLLALGDVVEAVMRACFLSGTEKEVFEVWGREVDAEEVARVLIDEAKMTRFKVVENDELVVKPDEELVIDNWRRLRWQPEIKLADSMKETLQYFFTKADEDSRKKKESHENRETVIKTELVDLPKVETVEENKPERTMEVVIEEESEQYEMEIEESKIVEETQQLKDEEIVKEHESDFEEIKPLLVSKDSFEDTEKQDKLNKWKSIIEDIEWPRFSIDFKNKWVWVGGAALLMLLFFFISGGIWISQNYGIYKGIVGLKQLIVERKYDEASAQIDKIKIAITNKESEVEDLGLNKFVWGRRYQMLLKVSEQSLVLGSEAINLSKNAEDINQAVFNDANIDWATELAMLKTNISATEDDLGVMQARMAGDWNWVPARWKGDLTTIRQTADEIEGQLAIGKRAVDLLPELLATDGKTRDYMVLLQNESEIRPTGGFIGSWALVSFKNGKLIDFQIKDVYEADGQLKGHVEPPDPIKNYLGQANWYMRDANWKPDFVAASKDIQWFLEKETGRKVDGVFGIDLAVAKAMLSVTGEIYVPDFKERVNKNNLYEQAEFYSETNSFAGSTQKASFLGGLGKQLFEEVKNLKADKRVELIRTMLTVLDEKDLLLSFNDRQTAAVVSDLGWDGTIYNGKCAQDRCFADYLYVVEANVGVNKANYFLYRNIDQSVDIGLQSISRVVKISYENTAKSSNWPGGDYKNYLRVYIPESSNLGEVSVTDPGLNGVKTIYQGDDLTVGSFKGKKEVGFLVTVPVGTKRIVEVRYSDAVDLSGKDNFSYLHYIQKQPGSGETGLVTLVSIPDGWTPNQVEPSASLVDGKILFNQKLDKDIKMGVELGK